MGDGIEYKFNECTDGLYYYDTTGRNQGNYNETKSILTPYSFEMTVNESIFFPKREVLAAEDAQHLQQRLGWPSLEQFKQIAANNLIRSSNITIADIDRAQFIFGTQTPLIQGKTIRSPNPKERIPRVSIPPSILIHRRDMTLHIDIFFVNKIPFLHTKSEGINLLKVQGGASRSKGVIIDGIKTVIDTYHNRGFRVRTIHGDEEFDMDDLRASISLINLEITGRDKHDGPIERSFRTIKERSRSVCHSVPYRWYTKLMIN